jgi:hypothetical protein
MGMSYSLDLRERIVALWSAAWGGRLRENPQGASPAANRQSKVCYYEIKGQRE